MTTTKHRTVRARDVLEARRRERTEAVQRAIIDPIWCDAPDVDLAREHGVPVAEVRALRREHRGFRTLAAIAPLARELARELEWEGSLTDLLVGVLLAELDDVRRFDRHDDDREGA